MDVRLKANSVDRSPSSYQISEELLEQSKPALFIKDDPVVVDKHRGVWVERGSVLVYLDPDVGVPALLYVESVTDLPLVHHLVDDVPVLDMDGMEVVESVLDVLEHDRAELLACEFPHPARVVASLGPQQGVA